MQWHVTLLLCSVLLWGCVYIRLVSGQGKNIDSQLAHDTPFLHVVGRYIYIHTFIEKEIYVHVCVCIYR